MRDSWLGLGIVPMAHRDVGAAAAAEPWWVVVDSSTVELELLDVAPQALAATVGVGGAWGGGQLAM